MKVKISRTTTSRVFVTGRTIIIATGIRRTRVSDSNTPMKFPERRGSSIMNLTYDLSTRIRLRANQAMIGRKVDAVA